MARFDGKVALITGAASAVEGQLMGFGGRAAWRILREGGRVIIADIADDRGEQLRHCGRLPRTDLDQHCRGVLREVVGQLLRQPA